MLFKLDHLLHVLV